MRWEYALSSISLAEKERFKTLEWHSENEVTALLNKWGDHEWELVGVVPGQTWHAGDVGPEATIEILAIFKRALPDKASNAEGSLPEESKPGTIRRGDLPE